MRLIVPPLKYAMQIARPASIPVGRPRGAKLEGIRYERSLGRSLPGSISGQWFVFEDKIGRRYCQTDLIVRVGEVLCVLEAKYSWVEEGHRKLEGLYLPILREMVLANREVVGLVVAKRLKIRMPVRVVGSLEEGVAAARRGERVCWHWTGVPALARAA